MATGVFPALWLVEEEHVHADGVNEPQITIALGYILEKTRRLIYRIKNVMEYGRRWNFKL